MRFLLYGMYGSINVGDELVCHAVAQGLASQVEDSRFLVMSENVRLSQEFQSVPGAEYVEARCFSRKFWFQLHRILLAVLRSDAIVVGGGGLFQDQYCWRLSAGSLFMAALGVALGKPVICPGVGVGPLKREWLRNAAADLLPHVDSVCPRDSESADCLRSLGVTGNNMRQTADVVPSFQCPAAVEHLVPDTNLVSFVLRDWPGLEYAAVGSLMNALARSGYRMKLHCYEPEPDRLFYKRILDTCPSDIRRAVEILVPSTLLDALAALKQSAIVLSMRLHGCILSAHLGVPFVPVLYERKVRGFAEQMGLADRVLMISDLNASLADQITPNIRYFQDNCSKIRRRFASIQANSRGNFSEAVCRIQGSRVCTPDHTRLVALRVLLRLCGHAILEELRAFLSGKWIRRCLAMMTHWVA